MYLKARLGAIFATAAIVATACSSSTTPAPSAPATQPASQPASQAPAASATAPASVVPSTAPLSGSLTIWEAYGASGTTEKDAFDKIVAQVMTANPGLKVTVTDVPFNNLFTNFETQAGAGAGPDMYIAPNDSLPSEARATRPNFTSI